MKNHISRLTQLSQKQSAEHRVEILEAALSQALSENQELEHKLMNYSKPRRAHSDSDESSDGEGKSFISNLIMENTKLNQEIKTLHMLKLNEADKVRTTYSLLHLKEQELDQVRANFAQTKFELEEEILKLQNPDAFQVKDIEEFKDETEKNQLALNANSTSPDCYSPSDSQELSENSMDNEEIQKVIQSLSGVSTPLSNYTCPVQETSKSPSRKVKVDRSRVGQECNQQ